MAISHLRAKIIGAGRSAIQSAAYRHRTKMHDELEGSDTHRYNKEKDLVYSEFSIPENSPPWIEKPVSELADNSKKSEWLWNYVQNNERINGQLAREIVIALPNELTKEQNISLMQEFIQSNITSRGLVSDWVYHDKEGNPHVHLMHTLRPVAEHGLGKKKIPVLNEDGSVMKINNRIVYETVIGYKDGMKDLRNSWGEIATRHLALAGHDIKVDMRSYAERGLSVEPTIHLGQSAAAMGKKGIESTAISANERARKKSAERIMAAPDEVLKIISSEKSTFTKKDIAKVINRYIDSPEAFSEILMRIEQSEQLVKLYSDVKKNAVFSTKDLVETEYNMARNVASLSQTKGHAVKSAIVARAIATVEKKDPGRPFKFADEQVLAVQHIVADNGIAAIVGYAGAGKSTLLEAANVAWVNSGRRVFGAALAGKAAEGLEESSGIKSRTLASWELGWKNGKDELRPGDVFVIDEAGMVSSRQFAHFIQKIENAGAKAVLVGDPMQLQPIEAGAAFRAIVEQVGYVELSGIRRQRQDWMQEASRQFARGRVGEALGSYRKRDFVHETSTHDEAIARIVQDWMKARHKVEQQVSPRWDELLVLAHTNAAVKKLNENIRSALKADGLLKQETAASFLTQRGKREFVVNDRIAFLENARFEEKAAPELGQQEVKNGMLGTVIATSDKNGGKILKVRLDSGREAAFTEETYQNIDHGYAVTVHKSQGVTVDNTFVLAAPSMDQHLSYVAMSRHRHDVHMYVAAEDFRNVRLREHYHVKGILTGELVETGFRQFDEKSARETPYADIKTAAGIERIYGVNLPAAIDGAGIQLGDTIELQQNKERIIVENRQIVRNNWTVELKERGNPDIAVTTLKNDNFDKTYDKLVASLSRSGAKSTTLDFATSPDYRDYIAQFTENRGIDVTDTVKERVSRQLEANRQWVNDQKAKLAALWERAKSAFDRIQGKNIEQKEPVLSAEAVPACWLPAITEHKISVEDAAKAAVRNEKSYAGIFAEMTETLRLIYKDPQAAAIKIEQTILADAGEKMPAILAKSPEKAGELRGSDRLLDKLKAAGKERKAALDALPVLVSSLKELQSVYKNSYGLHVSEEAQRRERMAHEVPALSGEAISFMQKATAGRDMPAHIQKEFSQFSDALDKRFGHDAIHKQGFDLKQPVDKKLVEAIKFVQEQRKAKIREIAQSRAKGLSR